MKKYLRVFEIRPGGWLFLSILFFFAEPDEFLLVLLCVLIHETGHLLALIFSSKPSSWGPTDAMGSTTRMVKSTSEMDSRATLTI